MAEQLIQWDKALLVALNGSSSLFLDGVMTTITETSTWLLLFACLLFAVIRNNNWRASLLILVATALLVTLTDQFSSGFCKPYFHRLRPSHSPDLAAVIDLVNGSRSGLYGFISSHASNTFGVAVFFTLLLRSRAVSCVLLLWACLSSYSRIYLGLHYPGDILAGALWGVFCGAVFCKVCRLLLARYFIDEPSGPASEAVTGYRPSTLVPTLVAFPLTLVYVLVRAAFFCATP